MFEPITINQFIDITTSGINSNKYYCRVKDILGERLHVAMPGDFKDFDDFIPGSKVKVSFSDRSAVFSFLSEIIVLKPGNPGILILGRPVNMTRIQRRNFVRLDAKLKVVTNKIDEDKKSAEFFTATTTDISGGGVLLGCDSQLNVGEEMEAIIFISENQTVSAIGRIVRVTELSASSKYKYSVGLEFTNIKEPERDKIIKYIFDQQRQLRTKGLL